MKYPIVKPGDSKMDIKQYRKATIRMVKEIDNFYALRCIYTNAKVFYQHLKNGGEYNG